MKSLDVWDVVVRYDGASGMDDVVALDHVSVRSNLAASSSRSARPDAARRRC
jgi:hypothetical protein